MGGGADIKVVPPGSAEERELIRLVTHEGERVTHLAPDWGYVAHLSIYDFATEFSEGRRVLDAGSGAGYGSAYLAQRGAQAVVGLELSLDAVEFSRRYFGEIENLSFVQMDLNRIEGLGGQEFDLVFSSNVLEHIADVYSFFESAVRLLTSQGVCVLAVPPIQNDPKHLGSVIDNLNIPYHVNIWTIRQWGRVLSQFFESVSLYSHEPLKPVPGADNADPGAQTGVRDFAFEQLGSYEDNLIPTITAVFVASRPRQDPLQIDRRLVDRSFYVNPPPASVAIDVHGVPSTDIISTTDTRTEELSEGSRLRQPFICDRDNLCGLALLVDAHGNQVDAALRLTVVDHAGEPLRVVDEVFRGVPANGFWPFSFEPVKGSKGSQFALILERVGKAGAAITVATNAAIGGHWDLNGEEHEGGLCFKRCYRD